MSHDLTLAEVLAAWQRRQRPPETLRGCTVEAVAVTDSGFVVRYRTVRGGVRSAVLRAVIAVPALYAGWYGTLVVANGVIMSAEEAA